MKKTGTVIVLAVMFLLSAFNAYAKDAAVDPVSQADAIVAKINSVTDVKEAVKLLDSAYAMYKKAAETAGKEGLPENVYYQLAQYANYKYHHMDIGTVDEKKKAYADVITLIEKSGLDPEKSEVYNYCLALMWARKGDISDLFESASNGMADKIKKYSEKAIKFDGPNKSAALLVLGRLHWKAPNIPFVITWPDKNKAKELLAEALKLENSMIAKFFLADAMNDTNEKEKAAVLFKEVLAAPVSAELYWQDLKTKGMCEARVKELGIK
ncbi:MAG TPA: hypothetical protein PLB12_04580 [Candidatus Goldiibacteriota bacterium]|nr:hypothetical protein [Candidatus Goldiibacteriota bacterium]HPI02229.1 hypothetical protein [Candidatus Goldiibacteriota bacterium]HPN63937.1 hypothetical protein [Candidatus Goldiibacteriota bacterium]HRQ43606.1 hypothetical protein [Candidatus Goldiibacteriota bacterium]